MQSGSTFKKKKKSKKRSKFTSIKSLNRYNLRHNNCIIFSIFLYFKYSFLSNSFIYKFVRAIIFISYQLLICRVAKNLPVLQLLNHFIKSSTVAYKRVAYKKKSSTSLLFAKTLLKMTLHLLICRFSLRIFYFIKRRELNIKKF